jgi:hypothetical protein
MRRLPLLVLLLALPLTTAAQTRPLTTPEADTIKSGEALVQFGFEFLQDARFPLTGLEGDLTRVGMVDVRLGVGRAAELEIQGVIRNFLSVSQQVPGPVMPELSRSGTSTSDVGDFTVAGKFRLLDESDEHPAVAVRFGFEMPNTNERRGLGFNTTNVFFTVIGQKHIRKLNVFGQVGLGILQAPMGLFAQNDVVLYGLGASYPVHERVNVLGEVAGRWSTRSTPVTGALVGTGSRAQARVGVQLFAGGLAWDFAALAGLTRDDPDTGFVFGVSRQVKLFRELGPVR